MVTRRAAGEPLEQIVGWAEFCGLRVLVDPGVFVPRRRSEFLVEVAVMLAASQYGTAPLVIADLCCGTGALGLAVAVRLARSVRPACADEAAESEASRQAPLGTQLGGVELHAADLDPAAVACARLN